MNFIEKFRLQQKKKVIHSILGLAFWIPALAIKMFDLSLSLIPMRMDFFTLILQGIGLIFIIFAYIYSLCPKCKSLAGAGWSISECRKCGQKLGNKH